MIAALDSTPKRALVFTAAALAAWAIVRRLSPPTPVPRAVEFVQRTITVYGSLLEVETYFLEEARDLGVAFEFTPRISGVEVRAISSRLGDEELRALLRTTKQMIEAGEVARADSRVHGPRSRRERRSALA